MAVSSSADGDKVVIKLSEEQKQLLVERFGQEFANRINGIEVEKVAQFLRTDLKVN